MIYNTTIQATLIGLIKVNCPSKVISMQKPTGNYNYLFPLFSIATFALTFMVLGNVTLYGDDYFYHSFLDNNLADFISTHLQHYMMNNGRVFVHLLVTIFLALPLMVWKVFNSLLLGIFVYGAARIVMSGRENSSFIQSLGTGAIIASSILLLDVAITRQSIYWLTGSFNYVYPLVFLVLYWIGLLNAKNSKFKNALPILAFFSAASTEQNAMMTVGLGVLYLINSRYIAKEKADPVLVYAAIASLVGALTVFLAPATFVRYSMDNKNGIPFSELLLTNLVKQHLQFLTAKYMIPFQIMFYLSSAAFILRFSSLAAPPAYSELDRPPIPMIAVH